MRLSAYELEKNAAMQATRRYGIRHLYAAYRLQRPIWAQTEPKRVDNPQTGLLWLKSINEYSSGLGEALRLGET